MASQEYNQITIKCANCATEHTFGSMVDNIGIEICSQCHPFYTGKSNLIDTSGRLEKFHQRVAKASSNNSKTKKVKVRKAKLSIAEIEGEASK